MKLRKFFGLLFVVFLLSSLMTIGCTPSTGSEPAAQNPTAEPTEEPTEVPTEEPIVEGEQLTMFVGPEQKDCVGVAPQTCLLIKFEPEAEWQFFYDAIEGFEYEPGFEYELLVEKTDVENPPADASSIQYTLIEEVSKTAVEVEMDEQPADEMIVVPGELLGQTWQWVEYQDSAGLNDLIVDNPALYTITFNEDGSYAIAADCNSGMGSFTAENNAITFEQGIMTLAMCSPESLDQQFLSRLNDVVTYVVEDGRLYLNLMMDAGNMVFAPAAEITALDGTSWTLNGLLVGGDAMTRTEFDSEITLNFADGRVTGSAACNSYGASYEVNGDQLTIGAIEQTEMACEEDRMSREMAFLELLGQTGRFEIVANTLSFFHQNGDYPTLIFDLAVAADAPADAPQTLEGPTWTLNGLVIGGDAVSATPIDQEITAQFVDGQLNGFAGCNNYFASYELDGETITLGPVGATRKACLEDNRSEREAAFLAALENVDSYGLEAGMLTLFDAEGLPLVMFTAQ